MINSTHVCCVKVKNIRPQYQNLKEWMNDPQNVYIARRGIVFIDGIRFPPTDSIWSNPYKIDVNNTREDAILKYRDYIKNRIENDHSLKNKLINLKGKTLGCWCNPEPCHGDVLVEIIEELLASYIDTY